MLILQSVEFTYNRLSLLLSIPVIIGLHESKDRLFLACQSVCLFVRSSVSLSVTCLRVQQYFLQNFIVKLIQFCFQIKGHVAFKGQMI